MTSLHITSNVATVTLLGSSKQHQYPWGTYISEHRWNPTTINSLQQHLLAVKNDPHVHALIVHGEGKFWSNGLDLAWIDTQTEEESNAFTRSVNAVMALILSFPIPTIAALNGHWCAAGGMMGLCFDYRVMNSERGYFFVPAVDLGIVYSAFQIELMKSKLPFWMHREVIVFNSTRWQAHDLKAARVIHVAVPASQVLTESSALANQLIRTKGHGPSRLAMGLIKRKVYAQVIEALQKDEDGLMNFEAGRKKGSNYAPPPTASKL